jgi:hypothetical protein
MSQASHEFRGSVDFNNFELRNARFQLLGTFPASPVTGKLFYNSLINTPFYYNGSKWNPFGLPPVHIRYTNEAALFADQAKQIEGYIYYDTASNIYYEYLGTTNGDITDYNPLGGVGHFVPYTGAVSDVNLGNHSITLDSVIFNDLPLTSVLPRQLKWNQEDGTLDLGLNNGGVVQQIGLETYYRVKNQTGVTIPDGTVVMSVGTLGASGRILIAPAIGDGSVRAKFMLGVTTESIPNGQDGFVTWFGNVRGINTTGSSVGETWVEGDTLWLNPSVAGGFTKVEPSAPNLKIPVAIVIHAATNGNIFVRPNLGSNLSDLHDVNAFSPIDKNVISYDSTLGYWKTSSVNSLLDVGAGLSIDGEGKVQLGNAGAGVIDISNSNLFDNGFEIKHEINDTDNLNEFSFRIFECDIQIKSAYDNFLENYFAEGYFDISNQFEDGFRVFIGKSETDGDQILEFASAKGGIILTDSLNLKGLVYASDYSANGTLDPRWIPDWGAVTSAITGASHDPVTLGTPANGLSLVGQVLSIGLASSGVTGALSGTDWDTFNGKIGGSIASGQVAFGTGVNTVGGDALFLRNIANGEIKITSTKPSIGAIPSPSRGWLIVTNGTNSIAFDSNEIVTDSNLVLTPSTFISLNSSVIINSAGLTPTNTLDVNGTARIRTISNLGSAATSVLVPSATGVLSSRTVAELRSDIGAIGGTIASGQVAFGTGVNTIGGDSGLTWDNVNKRLGVGGTPSSPINIIENNSTTGINNGLTITQQGTGDAIAQFVISGIQRWVLGIDNSDSYSFKLASSADLASNVIFKMEANGASNFYNFQKIYSTVDTTLRATIFSNTSSFFYSLRESDSTYRTVSIGGDNTLNIGVNILSNGSTGINTATPSNTLDVNGTARIRTISNLGTAATSVLVPDATGVISSRTVSEFRSDISAITLSEARAGLTLTTFGNSGIAEYDPVTGILNIPEYNLAGLGAPTTLAELTDVTITSPTTDQFLRYNGTEWVNVSLDISPSSYQRDKFIYSSSNTFTLTRTTPNAVQVFLNGQKQEFTDDWSISGNTVTVNTPLLTGDEISIEYFYSTPDVVSSNLNGTGTAGFLTKWNGSAEFGVSLIQDNGSLVTLPAATDIPAVAATTDTDKFMVLDSNRIKFRTGSQILSDIGAAASSHNQNASTIQAGTFGSGNYIFPGNVGILGQLYSPSNAKGNSGTGTVTFNWNDGNMQTVTLNGNCTFAFSNPQSGGVYQIIVTRDGTANRTINWPAGIKWGSGVAWQPAGANIIDIVTISYNGTTYFAVVTTDLKTV